MSTGTIESLGITPEKITQYDQRIPRYTSYPTAPFWRSDFTWEEWRAHLDGSAGTNSPFSLYVHVPFCEKHCLFCACNVIITPKKEVAEDYLGWLEKEIALTASHFRGEGEANWLHLGGGTPNYLNVDQLQRLVTILKDHFRFAADAERSIEIDPRLASPEQVAAYHDLLGFRRISFGVQDFHAETQSAIGRGQTREITFANVASARAAGFRSVNIDLIYGLPRQSTESWSETLDAICELRPDRIALYNFAFLPTKLAHQRALSNEALPPAELKLEMFIEAHNRLTAAGWEFIGMDHYALREDSLTKAQEAGSLRRNFMGYTTLRGSDMLAFGTSAISDFRSGFAQNTKKLSQYKKALSEGIVPVEHGMILSEDDRLRQFVIEELMCNGALRYTSQRGFSEEVFRELVTAARERLEPLAEDGLVTLDDDALRVTRKGRIFLRNIAVVFDSYFHRAQEKKIIFSRAV
ncbi:oxygen-independent coproporphyrinogen III oxidase [bacterium]|nr:oxygen-independent coproporphyrinogen III oxidase [bacterium]